MSFWKGVVNVLREKDQHDYETRERQKERDYRTLEKKEDRAYEERMFMKKINEERRTALYSLLAERKAEAAQVDPEDQRNVMWVQATFGNVEGGEELAIKAEQDPVFATKIRNQWDSILESRKDTDMITPETFVGGINAFGMQFDGGTDEDWNALLEEIGGADTSDPATMMDLQTRIKTAGRTGGVYDFNLDPSLTRQPDFERFDDQNQFFGMEIASLADQEARRLKAEGKENEARDLIANIQNFDIAKLNNPATAALLNEFGLEAFRSVSENQSTLFDNAWDNPLFMRMRSILEPQEDQTEEAIPTEGEPAETAQFDGDVPPPESTPLDEGIDSPDDLPEEIVQQIMDENVTFAEFLSMSRSERERRGLPTSKLGGLWRYRNRNGGWSFWGTPDVKMKLDFSQYPDADPSEIISRLVDEGELSPGDRVSVNGKVYTVREN